MKRTEIIAATDDQAITATWDVTPVPGTVVSDLGHGVTVVRRNPPRTGGAAWVAPYSLNCAAHGWLESRRTVEECSADGRQHVASDHEPTLECPCCGGSELTEPALNEYAAMATDCHGCGARMTQDAATVGTHSHGFIWNSRNQDFRAAGYTGVSINETGRGCSGGMEDLPVGRVAWQSADGWLWCRMHLDAHLREISTPRGRFEHAQRLAERVCREARNAAHDRYLADHDLRAYDHAVIVTGHARRAALLEAWHTYRAESGQATPAHV